MDLVNIQCRPPRAFDVKRPMAITFQFHDAVREYKAGRLEAAERGCRVVLAADPNHADALHLLGLIALQRGGAQEAGGLELIHRAMEIQWSKASAHCNQGDALKDQGRLEAATASYLRALELAPHHAVIYANLGSVLQLQGNWEEAVAAFRRASELAPQESSIQTSLGTLLQLQGRLGESEFCFQKAMQLKPDLPVSYNNLGGIFQDVGRLDETVACLRKALELKPDYASARSNLLNSLQYRGGVTLAELATAHWEFEQLHAAPLRGEWMPFATDRDPGRPLMVGLISPNFSQHPVGHFVIRALENLDRDYFKTVCYSDRNARDDWTRRFRAASTIWRETSSSTDAELAEQIRSDRVDILFDLAGHTAKNRLLVFARKPAPIQITWADYVGTTGLAAIDYLLADRYEVPEGTETFYSERVLRMPNGYICYDPPPYAPPVSPLPAMQQGFVTFSSFNYRPKISPQIVEVWSEILRCVPNSRLVLKNRGMDDSALAEPLRSEFANCGVEPSRIECLGWSAHRQLLDEYLRIDVALDPFPYNGGLTTCEAMWMGVPVITCPGETFASRHALSHLSNVGLTETIARDLDEYVAMAVSLATDLPRLAALRSGLRERVAGSPLCDGKTFARDLMRILRETWRWYCKDE
jgi:protein O-GlcNAc transferase